MLERAAEERVDSEKALKKAFTEGMAVGIKVGKDEPASELATLLSE